MKLDRQKLRKMIQKEIYSIVEKREKFQDETYEDATVKNLMLDKETSHGGWPEGPSKSFISNKPVNVQIADWLKKMKMIK